MAHDEFTVLTRRIERLERKVAGNIALNLFAVVIGALAIVITVWWIPASVDAWNRNAEILERAFPKVK